MIPTIGARVNEPTIALQFLLIYQLLCNLATCSSSGVHPDGYWVLEEDETTGKESRINLLLDVTATRARARVGAHTRGRLLRTHDVGGCDVPIRR